MKALNHLNLYEAKDKQHKELQDIKQKKQAITVEDKYSQTDKIIPKDFRKQWIGKSEGFLFDDSLILDYRSQISIKAVLIYKTAEHIVFMKFFYESNLKKRYESKIPIQSSVLRKYESKKYTARPGSFLKNFKVSLTNDKITKIELIWSDGDISLQGWDTDSSTKYTADIGADQRPISMFGSIAYHGKNNYALQSLGCEVNMIENE